MKKYFLLFLIMLATLQGCVVAIVAGATIGGVVIYEGRGPKTLESDNTISYDAQQKILADKELNQKTRIIVSSYDGIVLLAGQAPTPEMRDRAAALAQTVPGIKRTYNEIVIAQPISAMAQSGDAWITTKLKSQLLAMKNLNGSQIKVVTENGVVFLMGKVTPGQGRSAAEAARKIDGVQKVVTLFEYND